MGRLHLNSQRLRKRKFWTMTHLDVCYRSRANNWWIDSDKETGRETRLREYGNKTSNDQPRAWRHRYLSRFFFLFDQNFQKLKTKKTITFFILLTLGLFELHLCYYTGIPNTSHPLDSVVIRTVYPFSSFSVLLLYFLSLFFFFSLAAAVLIIEMAVSAPARAPSNLPPAQVQTLRSRSLHSARLGMGPH